VALRPDRLTPQRLARAVQRVLTDPRFGRAAAGCRPGDDQPPVGRTAVDVVERVMARANGWTTEGGVGHRVDQPTIR
jgi:UDP:flavonoid glycosyltransferase YjiC (YdhE family)